MSYDQFVFLDNEASLSLRDVGRRRLCPLVSIGTITNVIQSPRLDHLSLPMTSISIATRAFPLAIEGALSSLWSCIELAEWYTSWDNECRLATLLQNPLHIPLIPQ
jgi:hypothetical protein